MDIYKFDSELKYVNQIGKTLNVEEKLKLELAFLRLQETEKFDQICFWGKIEGVASDYYIALGLNFKGYYEFPLKKFFWRLSFYSEIAIKNSTSQNSQTSMKITRRR